MSHTHLWLFPSSLPRSSATRSSWTSTSGAASARSTCWRRRRRPSSPLAWTSSAAPPSSLGAAGSSGLRSPRAARRPTRPGSRWTGWGGPGAGWRLREKRGSPGKRGSSWARPPVLFCTGKEKKTIFFLNGLVLFTTRSRTKTHCPLPPDVKKLFLKVGSAQSDP